MTTRVLGSCSEYPRQYPMSADFRDHDPLLGVLFPERRVPAPIRMIGADAVGCLLRAPSLYATGNARTGGWVANRRIQFASTSQSSRKSPAASNRSHLAHVARGSAV